jgi:hypothetical protein
MIHLLLTAFIGHTAFAVELNAAQGPAQFAAGTRPSKEQLISNKWIVTNGFGLNKVADSPWMAGPIGNTADGNFPPLVVLGQNVAQPRHVLEFKPQFSESTPGNLAYGTQKPGDPFPMSSDYPVYSYSDTGVTFTVTNGGNAALANLQPGDQGGSSASFECRARGADYLVCAATYHAANPDTASPALSAFAEKIFYYSILKKGEKLDTRVFSSTIVANQEATAQITRAYRCEMMWPDMPSISASEPPPGQVKARDIAARPAHREVVSFTMLSKPAPVGNFTLPGVGTACTETCDKVCVVRETREATATTFKIVNTFGIRPTEDLDENELNGWGVPLAGTIRIPNGGGESDVHYPPGFSATAEQYAKMLMYAPKKAMCKELQQKEPTDPYATGAGRVMP